MRSIHLHFNEDTYNQTTRQELIDRVKSVLISASIQYSTLGAKGFNETSNFLTSYIKVILKNEDVTDSNVEKYLGLTQLREACDVLVNIEGLYALENMLGVRPPSGSSLTPEQGEEFIKANQDLALVQRQIRNLRK